MIFNFVLENPQDFEELKVVNLNIFGQIQSNEYCKFQ
jgi:hypothetical protein